MSEKKYYWLKLKNDFFSQKEIKKLRKIAGGDTYTIIYLKMQLHSLQNGGKLFYEGYEDNFADEIALEIDEESENVRVTLLFLEKHGLIEKSDKNEYSIPIVENSSGSETSTAIRVRKHRQKEKMLQCSISVTPVKQNDNGEIEIEIEKELDIELELDKKKNIIPYKEIIDYLNKKTSSNYKYTTDKTKNLIKSRINEGFNIKDFKKCIDNMEIAWACDEKMAQYLRPETLFGTKFESYVNYKNAKKHETTSQRMLRELEEGEMEVVNDE